MLGTVAVLKAKAGSIGNVVKFSLTSTKIKVHNQIKNLVNLKFEVVSRLRTKNVLLWKYLMKNIHRDPLILFSSYSMNFRMTEFPISHPIFYR